MHCKSCDYALWNIVERTCPECGTAFRPSEHEFTCESVSFCCPHCDRPYQGTSDRGHLEPAEFECGCGRAIRMDEMILRIAPGFSDRDTRPGSMPWLQRRHRGLLKAFFQTIGMALVRPARLIRGVPLDASVGESLAYAALTTIVLFVTGALAPAVAWFLGISNLGMRGLPGGAIAIWTALWLVLGVAFALSLVLIWPLTAHLVLRISGGCRYGLDRTFQAMGYSAGANALVAIPCVGAYVGWIWWLVSASIMLTTAQRVHGGRAALAILALPLAAAVLTGGVIGIVSAASFGGGGLFTPAFTPGSQSIVSLSYAVTTFAWQNNGAGPEHAIELMLGNTLGAWGAVPGGLPFLWPGTKTTARDIPVCDGTLLDFTNLPRSQRLGNVQKVLEGLPGGMVAHRMGDFVFTYHGATLGTPDPSLWIVVMIPDPDANGMPAAGDAIYIGLGNYQVVQTTFGKLAGELKSQNQYRSTLGLVPLPDLITVTHDAPALKGDGTAPPTGEGDG